MSYVLLFGFLLFVTCTEYHTYDLQSLCVLTQGLKIRPDKKNRTPAIPSNFVKFGKIRPNSDWRKFCTVKIRKPEIRPNWPINRTELAEIRSGFAKIRWIRIRSDLAIIRSELSEFRWILAKQLWKILAWLLLNFYIIFKHNTFKSSTIQEIHP